MFEVEVKLDCPHVFSVNGEEILRSISEKLTSLHSKCTVCEDESENWICLNCAQIACSSYVNKHMVQHKEESNHQIVLSFSDLSVWCYQCDQYISDSLLAPIIHYFQQLHFGDNNNNDDDDDAELKIEENQVKAIKLNEPFYTPRITSKSLESIAEYVKSGDCQKVIILTGAGLSTAAGIPDFRTPNFGLYSQLADYNLPYPEAVFSIDYYKQNPDAFCRLAKSFFPTLNVNPTFGHYLISLFEKKGILMRNYTQNIDLLEEKAGVSEDKIIYAHGSLKSAVCLSCGKAVSIDFVKFKIEIDEIPKCEDCGGLVKPDIVFFGESLTKKFDENVHDDVRKCDLLIIMGTSLKVRPVSYLPDIVPRNCPRLFVDLHKLDGFNFDDPENYNDVMYEGDIDSFTHEFVSLLGWNDEFDEIISSNEKRQ